MNNLKRWQKWGLGAAGAFLLVSGVLRAVGAAWWYQETVWFKVLLFANYPAAELGRTFLNQLGIPRIYDAPVPTGEAVVINMTWIILGAIWWFFLGAVGSAGWIWLARRLRGSHQ